MTNRKKLNSLESQLENAKNSLARLLSEKANLDKKIRRKRQVIDQIKEDIQHLKEKLADVRVPPEAMLDYLIQKFKLDPDQIKREMVPEDIKQEMIKNGDGIYETPHHKLETKKGKIVTIYTSDLEQEALAARKQKNAAENSKPTT